DRDRSNPTTKRTGPLPLKFADAVDQHGHHLLDNIVRVGEFQRQRTGSFRRWVRTITINCMRDHLRKRKRSPQPTGGSDMVQILNALEDDQSQLTQRWEQEHSQHLLEILLKRVRREFRDQTWQAFSMAAIENLPTESISEKLGMSVNAVFVAKSKVLRRIREEGAGLLEEEG
ncbi:MAG: sigma-70 family RNA polymerase sigma factor, partial [Planctomycetota bacterium]